MTQTNKGDGPSEISQGSNNAPFCEAVAVAVDETHDSNFGAVRSHYRRFVRLNVGGKVFVTRCETLCAKKGSLLEKIFRHGSNHPPPPQILVHPSIGGQQHEHEMLEVFVDRDPEAFGLVLEYLRHGGTLVRTFGNCHSDITLLEFLQADANFFGLTDLRVGCTALLRQISTYSKQSDRLRFHFQK